MNIMQHYEDAKLELQIAPLIDVVFLLLIYFMVTASLIKKEADLSFMLPTVVILMALIAFASFRSPRGVLVPLLADLLC